MTNRDTASWAWHTGSKVPTNAWSVILETATMKKCDSGLWIAVLETSYATIRSISLLVQLIFVSECKTLYIFMRINQFPGKQVDLHDAKNRKICFLLSEAKKKNASVSAKPLRVREPYSTHSENSTTLRHVRSTSTKVVLECTFGASTVIPAVSCPHCYSFVSNHSKARR